MGPRQLTVKLGFFLDGDSWRRRGRLQGIMKVLGASLQFLPWFGSFVKFGCISFLCILYVRLCMRTSTYTFFLSKNTDTYYQKKKRWSLMDRNVHVICVTNT